MDIRVKVPSWIFFRSPGGIDPLSWFSVKFLEESRYMRFIHVRQRVACIAWIIKCMPLK